MPASVKAQLLNLVDELRHLRAEGVVTVSLNDGTLPALKQAVVGLQQANATTSAAPPAPAHKAAPATQAPRATSEDLVGQPTPRQTPPPKRTTAKGPPPGSPPIPAPPEVVLPEGSKQERWDWLRQRVLDCPVCNAHVRPGKQVVFGVGNIDADIFFCGEAPGADEEEQGEPFVGKAGQLLTRIIGAMGVRREDVYIGNIMNWRPEHPTMGASGNRPPTPAEMAFCLPYLIAQLQVIQPKVIVALGNTAVTGLLGPDPKRRMGKVRGHWFEFAGTPLLITYHPSYVLRNGSNRIKREVWEDILQVMEYVGMPISEKQRGFFS